jgi:AraC-like DNA-binding protein
MSARHRRLLEKHTLGPNTLQFVVREAECPALSAQHIAHVGIGDGAVPLHIVRTHLSGAYLHGTLGGQGRMLLDGRWQPHRLGQTSLAPAHVLHAFRAIAASRWQYCWVRYSPAAPISTRTTVAPVLTEFDARPLGHAIMGLYFEVRQGGDAASCQLWVDAIVRYVDRFVAPWREEARLVRVWGAVQEDLGRRWSLDELAGIARTSREHLRRLCQRSLGRSPMQQLTNIRVQHAAHLLATTELKIDAIAREVGYVNPFAFSNIFKKMTGLRPSSYRAHKVASRGA